MSYRIEAMRPEDWDDVRAIYREGIDSGNATFETEVPLYEAWSATHLEGCRLVARRDDAVLGWAALSSVSDRCVYGGVGEVSVYVGNTSQGQGVGQALLSALVAASEQAGLWTLQAGIFVENAASVAVHEKCGFRRIGVRERLGRREGVWRDVLLLERRSDVVGV